MNAWLNYIIEVNIGLLLFMAFYKLLLARETNFRMQRIFLLAGIFLSLLFPFFHFEGNPVASPLSMSHAIPSYWLPEVVVGVPVTGEEQLTSFSFWKYASAIYILGFTMYTVVVLIRLGQLIRIVRQAKTYCLHDLHIAESEDDKPTFSFFKFIFIGRANALSPDEKQQMIRHEAVHARQWHSFDILLINVLKIFFWFNPLIAFYKKTFIQLHEFDADSRAVENSDLNKYCSLLAKVALETADLKLANHFNNSLTVKRIEMMRTIKNKISSWKIAAMAFVIPVSFFVISCQDQVENGLSHQGKQSTDDGILVVVEKAPTFEGTASKLTEHLQQNIRYPKEALTEEGTVYVEFVVDETGAVSDAKVIQGVHPALDAEAVRAIKTLPAWTPGRQNGVAVKYRYVMPISFHSQAQGDLFETRIQPEPISSRPYKMDVTYKESESNGKTIIEGLVVSSETKEPLPGTTIIIKGTTKGTKADENGRFRLEMPSEKGQLVFSFVGYDYEEVSF